MNEQVSRTVRGRSPDVLTCTASLSNGEVLTPPEKVNSRSEPAHVDPAAS
jgi:site-specific DNA-methyltransferase (adenine-specific)